MWNHLDRNSIPGAMAISRHIGKLNLSRTALLICDIQEKFRTSISHFDAVVLVTKRMLDASRILKMPAFITEMYPKGQSLFIDCTLGFYIHFST
ncbi:unnamed protein product [Protopolystoma xenopodis]|uniref:Isochorismatase-like domain-containing protein n=1 Tax=Protopolystoma xenopodis TaxID=117903 RepID=A0A3S5APS7_9PLAT|nr:unnamed protein product [Protopolystoma xenopodis]